MKIVYELGVYFMLRNCYAKHVKSNNKRSVFQPSWLHPLDICCTTILAWRWNAQSWKSKCKTQNNYL